MAHDNTNDNTNDDWSVGSYVTVAGAARYLSMSEVWIRRAIRSGSLPHLRMGRAVRIAVADLDVFAAGHRATREGGDVR
jgi:excisionase family DNA binding protein